MLSLKEAHTRMERVGLVDRMVIQVAGGGHRAKGIICGVTVSADRPELDDAVGACVAAAEAVFAYDAGVTSTVLSI